MKISSTLLLRFAAIWLCGANLLAADVMPSSVEVVPVTSHTKNSGTPIGNIRVSFKDGHSELWTKRGLCLHAKITKNGLVGWTRFTDRNQRGQPVNDSIRLMLTSERWVDFRSGYPFIDDWDVAEDGLSVIVRSGFAHGSFRFEKFDIKTQRLIEQTIETSFDQMPIWARPLALDNAEGLSLCVAVSQIHDQKC